MKFDHIEDTHTTYSEHWTHGIEAGSYLFLYSLTSVIIALFQDKARYFKKQRRMTVMRMYFDIMSRWDSIQINQTPERKVQKLEYIMYREEMKIKYDLNRNVNYFTNLQEELARSKDFFIAAVSSYIHAFAPNILIDHAACGLIRIYLKMQFSKDIK